MTSNIVTTEQTLQRARFTLDQYAASIEAILRSRDDLLTDTLTELTAAGYDAKIVRRWRTHELLAGDVIGVLETFDRSDGGGVLRRLEPWEYPDRFDRVGVYAETWSTNSARITVHHGPHRVMLVDGRDVLAVKDEDAESEAAHRRSVARLRTLARHDDLRVRVLDHDIALVDPLDNVVHEGDVLSAFAWILDIDLDTPVTA
ncbi:hypothetical protein [Microbacterium sp.]|uniref:hypothetical protein n=1 Tax=Microbacterium sp. TaxID=51671 RepID=UPI002C9243EF|nr:hypothetical protein [Microbacterium sp.]HWL79240.1 hypothetical protein [Microbacterium sp.]